MTKKNIFRGIFAVSAITFFIALLVWSAPNRNFDALMKVIDIDYMTGDTTYKLGRTIFVGISGLFTFITGIIVSVQSERKIVKFVMIIPIILTAASLLFVVIHVPVMNSFVGTWDPIDLIESAQAVDNRYILGNVFGMIGLWSGIALTTTDLVLDLIQK